MTENPSPQELYQQYIQARQDGAKNIEAWSKVMPVAHKLLPPDAVKRLVGVISEWENRIGRNHYAQPKTEFDPEATLLGREKRDSSHQITQLLDEEPDELDDPYYFGDTSVLQFYVKGHPQPLEVRFADGEQKMVGRSTQETAIIPEIDLTPFGAFEGGVSRLHAVITRRDNQLMLEDFGSANRTTIGKQPLPSQTVHTIKDNEEISFARLKCRIRFLHPDELVPD